LGQSPERGGGATRFISRRDRKLGGSGKFRLGKEEIPALSTRRTPGTRKGWFGGADEFLTTEDAENAELSKILLGRTELVSSSSIALKK
jgi:hypothetical protein